MSSAASLRTWGHSSTETGGLQAQKGQSKPTKGRYRGTVALKSRSKNVNPCTSNNQPLGGDTQSKRKKLKNWRPQRNTKKYRQNKNCLTGKLIRFHSNCDYKKLCSRNNSRNENLTVSSEPKI